MVEQPGQHPTHTSPSSAGLRLDRHRAAYYRRTLGDSPDPFTATEGGNLRQEAGCWISGFDDPHRPLEFAMTSRSCHADPRRGSCCQGPVRPSDDSVADAWWKTFSGYLSMDLRATGRAIVFAVAGRLVSPVAEPRSATSLAPYFCANAFGISGQRQRRPALCAQHIVRRPSTAEHSWRLQHHFSMPHAQLTPAGLEPLIACACAVHDLRRHFAIHGDLVSVRRRASGAPWSANRNALTHASTCLTRCDRHSPREPRRARRDRRSHGSGVLTSWK